MFWQALIAPGLMPEGSGGARQVEESVDSHVFLKVLIALGSMLEGSSVISEDRTRVQAPSCFCFG